MMEPQKCSRCGKEEYVAGVYDPRQGYFCKPCWDEVMWPKIQAEAARNALPMKILLGLALALLALQLIRFVITTYIFWWG